jgi:hypothetical protein
MYTGIDSHKIEKDKIHLHVKNLIGENIDYLMVDDCIQFVFMIR